MTVYTIRGLFLLIRVNGLHGECKPPLTRIAGGGSARSRYDIQHPASGRVFAPAAEIDHRTER